jgi:hypothetical protein
MKAPEGAEAQAKLKSLMNFNVFVYAASLADGHCVTCSARRHPSLIMVSRK